jgi:hypothetical protein
VVARGRREMHSEMEGRERVMEGARAVVLALILARRPSFTSSQGFL